VAERATTRRDQERRARRVAAKAQRERERRRAERRRKIRASAWVVAAVAVVSVLGPLLVRDGSGGVTFEGDLRSGGSLDRLTLPALEGDGAIDYASYADRPLVINFFASWCPNCVAEMPAFERVHAAAEGRVAFLGISQNDPRGASIELAEQTGITYDTGVDERGAFFNALGATGMPTTVFVRPGGEIAQVWTGALDEGSLTQLIDQYLGVAL
jgi:thiol-disulfide isomerase/thioredoxin